jgi:predicted nucleic acid-binding protein
MKNLITMLLIISSIGLYSQVTQYKYKQKVSYNAVTEQILQQGFNEEVYVKLHYESGEIIKVSIDDVNDNFKIDLLLTGKNQIFYTDDDEKTIIGSYRRPNKAGIIFFQFFIETKNIVLVIGNTIVLLSDL